MARRRIVRWSEAARIQFTIARNLTIFKNMVDLCNNERNEYDGGDCAPFNDRDDAEEQLVGVPVQTNAESAFALRDKVR